MYAFVRKKLVSKFYLVSVRITSADIPALLRRIQNEEVELYDIMTVDELIVELRISGFDYIKLKQVVLSMGGTVCVLRRAGMLLLLRRILSRPLMLIGIVIVCALCIYLPSRILFVEVKGAENVPEKLIIERAARSGIYFGASRSHVRSEKIKNCILESLPQLQWVGVNTRGCVAVVSVKEK